MFQIQNPSGKPGSSSYGGTYLKFNEKGVATAKALTPGLDRWLRAAGYKITDLTNEPGEAVGYNPGDEKVADVTKYLAGATKEERDRVIALEESGKARAGILGWVPEGAEGPGGEQS